MTDREKDVMQAENADSEDDNIGKGLLDQKEQRPPKSTKRLKLPASDTTPTETADGVPEWGSEQSTPTADSAVEELEFDTPEAPAPEPETSSPEAPATAGGPSQGREVMGNVTETPADTYTDDTEDRLEEKERDIAALKRRRTAESNSDKEQQRKLAREEASDEDYTAGTGAGEDRHSNKVSGALLAGDVAAWGGNALVTGLDIADELIRRAVSRTLTPGSAGEVLGNALDASQRIFTDAINDIGTAEGVDMKKLKADPNAVGTFKGKRLMEQERALKQAALDVRRNNAEVLGEVLGMEKGKALRPEAAEQALSTLGHDQLNDYGNRIIERMNADPNYTDAIARRTEWLRDHPDKLGKDYPMPAKDRAVMNAYRQILEPIKARAKEVGAETREYNRQVRGVLSEAKRIQSKGVNDLKQWDDARREDFYQSLSPVSRAIMDSLGGKGARFTLDDFGNLSAADMLRARHGLDTYNIAAIPDDDPRKQAWRALDAELMRMREQKHISEENWKRIQNAEFERNAPPLDRIIARVGLKDSDPRFFDKIDRETWIPATRQGRAKVRSEALRCIQAYEDAVARGTADTSPDSDLYKDYVAGKNAKLLMDFGDRASRMRKALNKMRDELKFSKKNMDMVDRDMTAISAELKRQARRRPLHGDLAREVGYEEVTDKNRFIQSYNRMADKYRDLAKQIGLKNKTFDDYLREADLDEGIAKSIAKAGVGWGMAGTSVDRIQDPRRRALAQKALSEMREIESHAVNTKGTPIGGYNVADLELIRDYAKGHRDRWDDNQNRRYIALMGNDRLARYQNLLDTVMRYTSYGMDEDRVDPTATLEGKPMKRYKKKSSTERLQGYFGEDADMSSGLQRRLAEYLKKNYGLRSLDPSREGGYDSVIDRLDKASRTLRAAPERELLNDLRNKLVVDKVKENISFKHDKIRGGDTYRKLPPEEKERWDREMESQEMRFMRDIMDKRNLGDVLDRMAYTRYAFSAPEKGSTVEAQQKEVSMESEAPAKPKASTKPKAPAKPKASTRPKKVKPKKSPAEPAKPKRRKQDDATEGAPHDSGMDVLDFMSDESEE